MYRFFETCYLDKGNIRNAVYHNKRLNATISHHYGRQRDIDLQQLTLPLSDTPLRLKIIYSDHIEKIESYPITPRIFRSLKIIESDIAYPYKALDRTELEQLFSQRGDCDDVLIVRDGLLRDTSIANIALFDGSNWLTPRRPLLAGTYRAMLLESKKIHAVDLMLDDLYSAKSIALMNAIIGWHEMDISHIIDQHTQ